MDEHTDLFDDLDDFVAAPGLEVAGVDPLDPTTANAVLRKLRALQRQRGEVIAVAHAEQDRIDAWKRDRTETIDSQAAYLERILDGFMRAEHARTKAKTLQLPNGTLRLRAPSSRVEVVDQAAFVAWAREHHADLLTTPEPQPVKAAIKKLPLGGITSRHDDVELLAIHDPDTGEAVPGVLVERSTRDTFGFTVASADPVTPAGDNGGTTPREDNDG